MGNSNCCKDKGYYDKWQNLKKSLHNTRILSLIFDESEESKVINSVLSKVLNEMEKMEENAS